MSVDSDVADDPWLRFLEVAVAGLRRAADEIRGDRRSHYEGRDGWFGRARRGFGGSRIPAETSISQALVEVLRDIRARQIVEGATSRPHLDLTRLEFGTEVPRRHERGIGAKSQRTDIMIAIAQDDLDLRIEAKNLLSRADLRRHYLGRRGLGRFNDARSPYSSERFGGMLAYIMDGDDAGWKTRLSDALAEGDAAAPVSSIAVAGETFTITRHDRLIDSPEHGIAERRVTDVLHLMLAFEATPPVRRRCAQGGGREHRPASMPSSNVDDRESDVTRTSARKSGRAEQANTSSTPTAKGPPDRNRRRRRRRPSRSS